MDKLKLHIKPTDLAIVISVIWVIFGTYFIGVKQSETLAQDRATLGQKNAQLTQLQNRYDSLVSLSASLANYTDEINRLSIAFPAKEQAPEALIQAQTMADRSGVVVGDLRPGRANETGLPVQMTVSGSYDAIVAFMKELNTNIRPVTVRSLNLTGVNEQTGSVTATLSVLFAYNYSQPVVIPTP